MEQITQLPAMLPLYFKAITHKGAAKDWSLPTEALRLNGYRCNQSKIARYRQSIGARAQQSHLPMLYPQVLSFAMQMQLMTRKSFPFSVLGVVHLSNHSQALGLIDQRQSIDLKVSFDGYEMHAKGIVFYMKTEVFPNGETEAVWIGRAGYLYRTAAPDNASSKAANSPWGELSEFGETRGNFRIEGKAIRRYAMLSGDINPIHITGLSAKIFGFKRAIAHGMWAAAKTLNVLAPQNFEYTSEINFAKPIFLPASLSVRAKKDTDSSQFILADTQYKFLHLHGNIS